MNSRAKALLEEVRHLFEPRRDPARALQMAAYMKGHFPFLGLPRTVYQPLARPWLLSVKVEAGEKLLLPLVQGLWRLPEREYQYLAGDLLDLCGKSLTPVTLPVLKTLLVEKSWWDTIDQLSGRVLSPLVLAHPGLRLEMDRWSEDPNRWLRRAAILHQLGHRDRTDVARLFAYCERNAKDPEFFIRKAIGWALRQHARVDAGVVQEFVHGHPELSPLSRREALKHCSVPTRSKS